MADDLSECLRALANILTALEAKKTIL